MKPIWWLIHALVILVILGVAGAPFFAVAYAGRVATQNGCQLDEGSVHPCIVNGVDQGEQLYELGMLGWIGIATVPLGLMVAAGYIVLVVVVSLIRRKRKSRTPSTA